MIVGFTCGAFDLLHPGHVHLLTNAKEQCDQLWVGLHTDPTIDRPLKNKPIQSTFERYLQLSALGCVNEIIPYDTEEDLRNMLAVIPIKKRFVGSDYLDKSITAEDICLQRGIKIVIIDRHHGWSSSGLRERIENAKGQDRN